MPDDPTPSAASGTVRFVLKIQDCNIEVSAPIPEGPVRPVVLLPILQGLSSSISDLVAKSAAQLGKPLSCREGCGACCRHAVPITAVEARMISEWLDEQPEERRAVLLERFRNAARQLEESGLAEELRQSSTAPSRTSTHGLGLKYFALGIPCPFLENECCTIHPIRPLVCREYVVVSPAEHCAHPASEEIINVKPPVLLSQILNKWDVNGEPQSHQLILLTLLDEWVAHHPPEKDCARRTAPELLQEFLHAFAEEAQSVPADPRREHSQNSHHDQIDRIDA
jgi:Fe-S-cluster containining protein